MSIEIKNVSKSYGNNLALDDISLTFEENKIYGLLGRNGAGKSTLLNIITNKIFASGGEVLVDGEKAAENDTAQNKIYLMSEKTYYPESMKVKDAFKWSKDFYKNFDMDYAYTLCKKFELNPNKSIKSLSTGFLSVFKFIVALSVNTPYVLLDEPVLGLDANNRDLFYKLLIEKYSEKPFTAIISTHLIEEASNIIEVVAIIKAGKLIKNENRDELLSNGYTVSGPASIIDSFTAGKNVIGVDAIGALKSAYILGAVDKTALPDGVEITKLDLQKLFIQLTNA